MATDVIPPLPAGFSLDAPIPPLPPGFSLDSPVTATERLNATTGGANRGIAGLLGLPVDTTENLINLGIAGVGSLANVAGRPDLAPNPLRGSFGGSEYISGLMNKANIGTTNPRPDDPASRMLNTAGTIVGGSLVPGSGVGGSLKAAAGGAIAGEVLGPQWTGVGALAPGAASQLGANIKNSLASATAPQLSTFKEAGSMPSVGQATKSQFISGLENLASKFPGGSGVMKSFIENQQKQLGVTARTGVPTEEAGRAIESGIKGEGGFLARTKETWSKLDDAVAKKVPANYGVIPSNTLKVLDELTTPTVGAEKTSQVMKTPKIAEITDAMRADLSKGGPMPYQSIRQLRSKVGAMLDDSLVTGIPNGELKRLYGGLSADLGDAAREAGAGAEFARANNFYKARMGRVETVLERVIGTGKQPEDVFKSFYPTDPDQANKVRAVMRSLDTSERKVVTDAVVNRLGRATPGRQNDVGEVFSSETFLSNWNKLSNGAKAQLFPDPPVRENVEHLSKVSAQIRRGSQVFQNASGTAGSFAAYSVYASPIAAIATGSVAPLAAAAGAAGTAYVGAKMLTSPKVVEWLAKASTMKPEAFSTHLARLGVIYNQTNDQELKSDLEKFVSSSQGVSNEAQ